MKHINIAMIIPNLVKAGFKLWETSKEWNAKKRIAIFVIIPVSLIIFSLVVWIVGPEYAQLAAQILTETMISISDSI